MDRAARLLSDRLLAGWHGWWRCRKSDGVWLARKGQGVHSRGPQMKCFWVAKKGLELLTLMADVSLAAITKWPVSRRLTMSESRKSYWIIYASGRDEHVPAIGTV